MTSRPIRPSRCPVRLTTHEIYDAAADARAAGPPVPTARHGLGAAPLDGGIHVISGGPRPAFTFGDAHERLEIRR